MAASSSRRARPPPTVIDLTSSDEDDEDDEAPPEPVRPPKTPPPLQPAFEIADNTPAAQMHGRSAMPLMSTSAPGPAFAQASGQIVIVDGEEVFIPDSPGSAPLPAWHAHTQNAFDEQVALAMSDFTADSCLQRILGIFPDISHEHVLKLYEETLGDDALSKFERLVEKIISTDYPKADKGKKALKRKREDEDDDGRTKQWEAPERVALPSQHKAIHNILKADFPEIAKKNIANALKQHKNLYQTYVALANAKDKNDSTVSLRGYPQKDLANADTTAANSGFVELSEELQAARKGVDQARAERAADVRRRQQEEANLQRAVRAGETAECQVCYEDLPMNRQLHCNGETAHWTCLECITTYIRTEVGDSRCRVLCTAGCGSGYARAQLHLVEDKQLLEKFEQLQQEKDIRDAGLDDLEECPFCDYKVILPPIEQDFEFRCANPECEKISCRRCKSVSHIPKSCEEHAQENKLDSRHKIEEAMTAAMIRSCNKCKKQFIKDYGCNKMQCPSCNHLQCYVCSESLKDYTHFSEMPGGPPRGPATAGAKKCPLYDNVEERHEREVKEAEAAARAQVLSENPEVSEEDLKIKVSETVQKADAERVRRAGQGVPGAYHPGLFMGHHFGLLDPAADYDEDNNDDDMQENLAGAEQHRRAVPRAQGGAALRPAAERMQYYRALQVQRLNQLRARLAQDRAGLGLGGQIAGHNNQAPLARPLQPPQAIGLAHRPPPHVQGYNPMNGGGAAQQNAIIPQQQPRIARPPELHAQLTRAMLLGRTRYQAPQQAPNNPQQAQPAPNLGPGHGIGARNNGLGGGQGLLDAFAEELFVGGADADPFGYGRMPNQHAPPFNAMRPPPPEIQALYQFPPFLQAREQHLQALRNMRDRVRDRGGERLARDAELHQDVDPNRPNNNNDNRGRGFPGNPASG